MKRGWGQRTLDTNMDIFALVGLLISSGVLVGVGEGV